MPRYFFHIMDGRVQLDHEGQQLLDIWEVRKEALRRSAAYLSGLDNVLITPHNAGAMRDYTGAALELFLDNLGRFVRGEPLRNVVDKERGY